MKCDKCGEEIRIGEKVVLILAQPSVYLGEDRGEPEYEEVDDEVEAVLCMSCGDIL